VTQNGELADEHGAIAFGPRQSATSLVSRRSQLGAARLDLPSSISKSSMPARNEFSEGRGRSVRPRFAAVVLSHKSLDYQAAAAAASVLAAKQQIEHVEKQLAQTEELLAGAQATCETNEATLETARTS